MTTSLLLSRGLVLKFPSFVDRIFLYRGLQPVGAAEAKTSRHFSQDFASPHRTSLLSPVVHTMG